MPNTIYCEQTSCVYNEHGRCGNDDMIELDSNGTCQTYEPQG